MSCAHALAPPRHVRTRPRVRRAGWLFVLAIAGGLATAPAAFAGDAPTEYDVKAALLFNFGKFADWPATAFASADSPFVIGVVGVDPFRSALDRAVSGKTLAGHPIVVRRWRRDRDLGACEILFVAASEADRLPRILEISSAYDALVVGDSPEFAVQGGAIGFVVDDARIRFEINPAAAEHAHVRLSSKLLGLARIVAPAP